MIFNAVSTRTTLSFRKKSLRSALKDTAKQYVTILWEAMDPSRYYGNAIAVGLHLECLAYLEKDDFYRIS